MPPASFRRSFWLLPLIAVLFVGCTVSEPECAPADASCSPFAVAILATLRASSSALNYVYWGEASGTNAVKRIVPAGGNQTSFLTQAGVLNGITISGGTMYLTAGTAINQSSIRNPLSSVLTTTGGSPVSIDADDSAVYWIDGAAGSLNRYNFGSATTQQIVPSGLTNTKLTLGPETYFFRLNNEVRSLDRINGGALNLLVSGLAAGGAIDYNPADGLVYFNISTTNEVRAIRPDGTLVRSFTVAGGDNTALTMAVDPTGSHVYVGETGSGKIYRFNTDGTGQQLLTTGSSIVSMALEFTTR